MTKPTIKTEIIDNNPFTTPKEGYLKSTPLSEDANDISNDINVDTEYMFTTGEPIQVASEIMQYFKYEHLPENLQNVSKPFCDLAEFVETTMDNSAEKSVCLRRLLEAKDAGVRAAL